MIKNLVILGLVPCLLFGEMGDSIASRMYTDLDTIKGIFESQYAPMEWKRSYAGWDLDDQIALAKAKIDQIPSAGIKDYQKILKEFINSTMDFHVSVHFFSTETAGLPFQLKSANQRYYIVALNRTHFPKGEIQVGDEVITFNEKPIRQAVLEFIQSELGSDSLSAQSIGEMLFTNRQGSQGMSIPQGKAVIGIKHKKTNAIKKYNLKWSHSPEKIVSIPLKQIPPQAAYPFPLKLRKALLSENELFAKKMRSPLAPFLAKREGFSGGEGVGERKSFIPTLGKKIWVSRPTSEFYAYVFETSDHRRFGYIRIPEYSDSDHAFLQFKELIALMQVETEALVIDQLNNPGGSVFQMYAFLSTLTDYPLELPLHRITLTQKEIAAAIGMLPILDMIKTDQDVLEIFGDDLSGMPVTLETVKKIADYFYFQVNQWSLGLTFTDPYPLWGISEVTPHPEVRYTKPILVLINQLDFSCGDFFPAVMQDNARATLLGTTTGGAGGFVLTAAYPNLFGIAQISYTGSLAYRKNNRLIENLGVEPDIEYRLTNEDLTNFYTPFKQKILESIKNLTR